MKFKKKIFTLSSSSLQLFQFKILNVVNLGIKNEKRLINNNIKNTERKTKIVQEIYIGSNHK